MVIYWKSGRRRPVWVGRCRDPDVQGRIPRGWCSRCGMEVWDRDTLCPRCKRDP